MLGGFSIDDVRDSFRSDVKAQSEWISRIGQEMLAAPELGGPIRLSTLDGESPFGALARYCHAIHGSSAQLSLSSLADTSRSLEQLAEAGATLLLDIESRVKTVRTLMELYTSSALCFDEMAEL